MTTPDGENLHPNNQRELRSLQARYYFQPLTTLYKNAIAEYRLPDAADHLTEVMRDAQPLVEKLLTRRKADGEITDISQARKSIAGNGFQLLVWYALALLQAEELLPSHLVFTLRTQNHPKLGNSIIKVGPEILKPDVDLLVYSDDNATMPVCIYSLKTSLRERAGQTHRWKILLDIVTSENCHSIKEKYDLRYDGDAQFRMGLITTNFYDEITNPQQKGLLRFFDYVYLTKPDHFPSPVKRFSTIVEDLVKIYGK